MKESDKDKQLKKKPEPIQRWEGEGGMIPEVQKQSKKATGEHHSHPPSTTKKSNSAEPAQKS